MIYGLVGSAGDLSVDNSIGSILHWMEQKKQKNKNAYIGIQYDRYNQLQSNSFLTFATFVNNKEGINKKNGLKQNDNKKNQKEKMKQKQLKNEKKGVKE